MAWCKDVWCVLTVIKFEEPFEPYAVLSIHLNKAKAQSLVLRLSEGERWLKTVSLLKYNRNIGDLKEGDILCGYKLSMILNYYEKECNSDVVREVIREAH